MHLLGRGHSSITHHSPVLSMMAEGCRWEDALRDFLFLDICGEDVRDQHFSFLVHSLSSYSPVPNICLLYTSDAADDYLTV